MAMDLLSSKIISLVLQVRISSVIKAEVAILASFLKVGVREPVLSRIFAVDSFFLSAI